MKTNSFLEILIAVILCSTFSCTLNNLKEDEIAKENEIVPSKTKVSPMALVQFPDNDWKGVVWEPHNFSWTNQGSANDGTDLVNAGTKWVRVWFKADYTTAEMDAMVNLCNARGLKIIACYNKTNPEHELGTTIQQDEQRTRLTTWVNRYKASIHYWEIHNEPNLTSYWCPSCYDASQSPPEVGRGSTDPNSPYNAAVRRYVQWLQIAYNAIKTEDPSATVILSGISEWIMEDWMDRFRIEGGYNYVDEIAFHPYGANPTGVISRLTSFKNKVAQWPAGKNNLPIWITEIGFHVGTISSPGQVPDEATKAAYLKETYQNLMMNLNWKRPICWYILHEVNPGSNYYNLLVRTSDASPATLLPAYNTYKGMNTMWGNMLENQGFENNGASQTPAGWSESSTVSASYSEAGSAQSGTYKLTHWANSAYQTYTYQNRTGLVNGLYTLKAYVKRGGTHTSCQMEAKNYGGSQINLTLPITGTWTEITIANINVTNGTCTIGFWSNGSASAWCNVDNVRFYKQQ